MPLVLDGKLASQKLLDRLKLNIADNSQKRPPCLGILQVGNNPASDAYIKRKIKIADSIGMKSKHRQLSSKTTAADIEKNISELCESSEVDALIVQLPLDLDIPPSPEWVDHCLEMIPAKKDADGLGSDNLGKLSSGASTPDNWTAPLPATAYGIMELLKEFEINPRGKRVLILGKSRLVGMPTAQLMLHAGATVSVAHSQSGDWSDLSRQADIIVVATGRKHLLKPEHIKDDVIIVDVGIHRTDTGLTGDVDPNCLNQCRAYSPVPGGVGQMTVACLMANVVKLWSKSSN